MRMSDLSSDVCSSDLIQQDVRPNSEDLPYVVDSLIKIPSIDSLTIEQLLTSDLFQLFSTDSNRVEVSLSRVGDALAVAESKPSDQALDQIRAEISQDKIGRASCRERVCKYV